MSNKKPVPIVGKEYNYFDDGKVKDTRLCRCVIRAVQPFKHIKKKYPEIYAQWCRAFTEKFNQLFDDSTDYFVFAYDEDNSAQLIFVRTVGGGWFSFNNNTYNGLLDVDGTYLEMMNEY